MLNIALRSRQFSYATLADREAVLRAQAFDDVADEDLMAELRPLEAGGLVQARRLASDVCWSVCYGLWSLGPPLPWGETELIRDGAQVPCYPTHPYGLRGCASCRWSHFMNPAVFDNSMSEDFIGRIARASRRDTVPGCRVIISSFKMKIHSEI